MWNKRTFIVLFQISLIFSFWSCGNDKPVAETAVSVPAASTNLKESKPHSTDSLKKTEEPPPSNLVYSFLKSESKQNLRDLIKVPYGFSRIKVPENSFAQWLRFLPAKDLSESVKLHSGELKPNQKAHFAIVNIDVGKRDLQQCADAVMRLKAEYHYAVKDFSKIHFNFTSGHKVAFDDWSKGRKPKISGNAVTFTNPGTDVDVSYPNFRKYMNMVFSYAGTASLSKELRTVKTEDMQIGDVFIQGGFPGHAIIVTDMAENEQGEKVFLIAQSYMPAQDIHILKNLNEEDINPWYSLNFGEQLNTPEWTFYKNDLKRFD